MMTEAAKTLLVEAIALVPMRHRDGDAAWCDGTFGLKAGTYSLDWTPQQLAKAITESLDRAQEEWEAERAYLAQVDEDAWEGR